MRGFHLGGRMRSRFFHLGGRMRRRVFSPWREDEEEGWSRGALGPQSGHASSALLCASFSENTVRYHRCLYFIEV